MSSSYRISDAIEVADNTDLLLVAAQRVIDRLAAVERERDEALAALDRVRKDIEGKDAALMRARVYGRDKDHRELAESLAQATALLRETRSVVDTWLSIAEAHGLGARSLVTVAARIDTFLSGQPAPAKVDDASALLRLLRLVRCKHGLPLGACSMHRNDAEALLSGQTPAVDDTMVVRAWNRVARPGCGIASITPVDMRAALVAALAEVKHGQ